MTKTHKFTIFTLSVFAVFLLPIFSHALTLKSNTNTGTGTGLNSGLVGWWTFDGRNMTSGRANDVSGNSKHANLINISTSTFYKAGKLGQAFNFDGTNDYLTAGNVSSSINTVAFWVQAPSTTHKVLDLNGTATVETVGGTITANNFTSPTIYVNGVVTSTITANTWYHVVITTGTAINASAVDIGRISSTYFQGVIDDVRVYNRVLSATEVKQLYNQGAASKLSATPKDPLKSGLVGWWTFDGKDVVNGVARDISGNGSHGNLINISTTTFYTQGKLGQGFNFDGTNDYLTAGNVSSSVKSVSLWMKGSSLSKKILDLNGTATVEDISGTITANNFTSPTIYVNGTVASTIAANTWYHVVITTNTAINANAVDIGRISSGYFSGSLDDVRFYNRALSATEIKQLYNQAAGAKLNATPREPLKSGLLLHWTFDGKDVVNGRVLDVSGNGNHGAPVNIATSTFYKAGKIGQGVNFDGVNDCIKTASTLAFNTKIMTLSVWVNVPSNTGGAGLLFEHTTNWNNNDGSFKLENGNASSLVSPGIQDSTSGTLNRVEQFTATAAKQWHNWTIIYDNTTVAGDIIVYVDGVLTGTSVASATKNQSSNFITDTLHMGVRACATVGPFKGRADDVRIYNRALSETEVLQLYNQGK